MTPAPRRSLPLGGGGVADAPAYALARRLAASGLGVLVSRRRDTCELAIVGAAGGKSFVALDSGGQARWYYEPAAGPLTSPATLTAIIAYLLEAPPGPASPAAYRGLPLKGQVGPVPAGPRTGRRPAGQRRPRVI